MNVRFLSPDPRQKAKPILDIVLGSGTDQIAIACAFLLPAGVELLKRHKERLELPSSFVVVAWEHPTSLDALNALYKVIPERVYWHLGSRTPIEKGVGRAIMHSKLFFAKAEDRCWLWTGSHNLTASATQGVNCEAALLIEGTIDEPVFGEALAHLNQCRAEATLFNPRTPPPPLFPEQTLVIHAECDTSLKETPWFVHLRPATTHYDRAMRPPTAVWLYLYEPGSLQVGKPRPLAKVTYSGTLTALNFTENHPQHSGLSADWRGADYVIEIEDGVPCLTEARPQTTTPSQGVIRLDARENPEIVWLTETPIPKLEPVVGETRVSDIDREYRRFFTKKSLRGSQLLHQEYRSVKEVMRVPRKEVGNVNPLDLQARLNMPDQSELLIDETLERQDRFAFIYRAKYRA